MAFIGKRDYKPCDCVLIMECKKNSSKQHSEVCDTFAQRYCKYINNGRAAAALLEACLDIERQIIDKIKNLSEQRNIIFKYFYSMIKHCSCYSLNDEDQSMLLYLTAISVISKNINLNYNIILFPYDL